MNQHNIIEHTTSNPVGLYLVLWEDGTIEKIPFDKKMYYTSESKLRPETGVYKFATTGQAGLPPGGLTYNQYFQGMGWASGPHGSLGGRGIGPSH